VQRHAVLCHGPVGSYRIDSRLVHIGFVVDKVALVEATLSLLPSYPVNELRKWPILVPLPLTVYNTINIGSMVK
jgi:hypothetical protein